MLIVYPKTSLLIYRRSTAPVWRRCCVDPPLQAAAKPFRHDLFVALVLILFGFVIFESDLVIAFIRLSSVSSFLANGLLSIQKAFNLKNRAGKWWLEFLLASLTSVLGIICTNPFDAVATTNIFIGICLVYSGISDLVTTYYMGRAKRRIKTSSRQRSTSRNPAR